jgi:hypothetical protein
LLLKLEYVQPGLTRLNVSLGTAAFTMTRDSVNVFPTLTCSDYVRWSAALAACHKVAAYEARAGSTPSSHAIENQKTILGAMRTMNSPKQRFWFGQLSLTRLAFPQQDVHGLLGQRAVSISGQTFEAGVLSERRSVSPLGKQGEGAIEGSYVDYKVERLNEHTRHMHSRFAHRKDTA